MRDEYCPATRALMAADADGSDNPALPNAGRPGVFPVARRTQYPRRFVFADGNGLSLRLGFRFSSHAMVPRILALISAPVLV